MKQLFSIALVAFLFSSCTNGQSNSNASTNLSATEFAKKISEQPTATILDVRTPGEFSKGHLVNAKNYDWNGEEFETQIKSLDKSKPIFVYCLSGSRSAAAAKQMRSEGFKTVYELKGGILKWRGANLPETTVEKAATNGMSKQQFDSLLLSDKLVLIDFYADWCEPCIKMKPYLAEISKEMANSVSVIRINADDNKELFKELKFDALPILQLYRNKALIWSNTGYITKEEVVKHLH